LMAETEDARTRLLELERFIYGHCSLYGAMCICLLVFSVVVYLKVSRHRPQGKRVRTCPRSESHEILTA